MFLKKVRILCLKRKIMVLKLDIVCAEQERAKHVPGREPKNLTMWINKLKGNLKEAEVTLNKIYAEIRKHWDGQEKKLRSKLTEANGFLDSLILPKKVALKILNKKIPSLKKKIAKAKKMQDRYS